MKKKALWKEFWMEIRKTFNRFMSIFLIVALGVAFFSGIRATKPDMQLSADRFYDENNLMDIRILGTLGITKEDVEAVAAVDGVKAVMGAYSKDVLCDVGENTYVIKLMSVPTEINQVTIQEGRMPQAADECVIDSALAHYYGYRVGDRISFYSGDDSVLEDSITNVEYTVVGSCITPYYLSFERGTSKIGSGSLKGFVIIPTENFKSEVFTELYVTVEGAAELVSYRDDYNELADTVVERLEALAEERNELRYSDIVGKANEELSDAEKELQSKRDEAEAELLAARKELDDAKNELESGRQQLTAFKQQLPAGYELIPSVAEEIRQQEAKLSEAEQRIASGEKDYETAKAETENKLADAQKEIDSAREAINDIAYPEWYVLDREYSQVYVEFGQNADRIGAIGEVFPIIFFLVAALISLTTMTRMVEEERTQIGTLKALGYSNASIAGKYLLYALLASIGGSIVGIFAGQRILPYVIITAYKILYNNLPYVETPINLFYSVTSALTVSACTVFAAYFACRRTLKETAATLMRPSAPKAGKRVFLEHVPFIWNRLSFSRKSSIRNMFRYKKRLFMTIFGIAGCMALIMVGFGLMDSIHAISGNQYKELFVYDGKIALDTEAGEEKTKELCEQLSLDGNITGQMKIYEMTVTVEKDGTERSATLCVPESTEGFGQFIVLRDRVTHEAVEFTETTDGMIISEKLSSVLDIGTGDTVRIKKGEDDACEVRIAGITENYMMHYVYMNNAAYAALYGSAPDMNTLIFNEKDNSDGVEAALGERMLQYEAAGEIRFSRAQDERIQDMMGSLNVVVWVLVISAGMLAFVVLYNLNNINIGERIRELATIKVLGFFDGEVAMYVYRENIMLTVIGILFGIVFGILLHQYIIRVAEIDIIMFGRKIAPMSYFYSIALTVVFAVLVNFVTFFKLKKIDMVESLKSVE